MSATYVLGINAYHADVSTVLLRDGDLVAAVEEERFRRVKHWAGFPTQSIRACLEMAGIEGDDVDHLGVSRDPSAHFFRKVGYTLRHRPSLSMVVDRLRNQGRIGGLEGPLAEALEVEDADLPTIHRIEHHPAHLASAFHVSPFERAAVCAVDGFGDGVSTSVAFGEGDDLEVLDRVFFPHSLGLLYLALTQYLGFPYYGDEYKVMGLAAYGEPHLTDEVGELVSLGPDGGFELDLRYFRHHSEDIDLTWKGGAPSVGRVWADELEDLLGPARSPEDPIEGRHRDLAASLQAAFEEGYFHVLNDLWERTRETKLCLAGGCAMNSVANGKVRRETPFEELYVQPAAADNGTALGAALEVWSRTLGGERRFVMDHAFWGPEHEGADVAGVFESTRAGSSGEHRFDRYEDEGELCRETARLVADGQVVGWYQGRMEWGARALGNRSILADPRRADTRDRINAKIKYREEFRPFAPSILAEAVDDYFVGAAPDPFMTQVYDVRPEKREVIPAVTHADGTGRLQAVHQETNSLYHRLIRAFEDRTGVPVVLNTSFNENEPIVESPEQAVDCFLRTDMDAVVIHDTLVRRVRAEESIQGEPARA